MSPRPAVEIRAGAEFEIEVSIGEVVTVFYTVTNQAARDHGQAAYNVGAADGRRLFPEDQLLLLHRADHGARARSARCRWCSMSIRRSRTTAENDGLNTITLSYTFYPGARAGAEAGGGERADKRKGNL
jgi:cytochrome c oxidase assembly protein subunit 11